MSTKTHCGFTSQGTKEVISARSVSSEFMNKNRGGHFGPSRLGLVVEWWAHLDSNQGPTGYEPVALTN